MSSSPESKILDATNLILGRMASRVAKMALEGESITVVNAEKAIISGSRASIVAEAKKRLATRTLASQKKSPTHPRHPETYVRRVIRGMLPWDKSKGREAFRRIRVFSGNPQELAGRDRVSLPEADASKLKSEFVTVLELSAEIGGRRR